MKLNSRLKNNKLIDRVLNFNTCICTIKTKNKYYHYCQKLKCYNYNYNPFKVQLIK